MNIKLENNCSLDKPGIYKIRNIINEKEYVGSSTVRIFKRMQHHYLELRRGKHKNKHLQRAWDKNGEENFIFIGIENIPKDKCLEKEQEYIDNIGIENLYNINPLASGTPNLSQETIEKRTKSFTETIQKASEYYSLFKNKEIKIDEVPEKYRKLVRSMSSNISNEGYFEKGNVPWNKGKTKADTDFSFLKGIKKTKTDKYIKGRINFKETVRNKLPLIYVYNLDKKYLGYWNNVHELCDFSLTENCFLHKEMVLKNKRGRNGYSPFILQPFNTQKSAKNSLPYKGLYFSNIPLHIEN